MRVFGVAVLASALAACSPPMDMPDGGMMMTCGTAKTPANLVVDPQLECGTQGWSAQFGTVEVVAGGRSGKALQLTASSTGAGQMGVGTAVVAMTSGKAYCLSAWVKGTASDARLEVLPTKGAMAAAFATPITADWVRAPMNSNLKVSFAAGDTLYLRVRLIGAQAGQTLLLDDLDFYESASGNCNERL